VISPTQITLKVNFWSHDTKCIHQVFISVFEKRRADYVPPSGDFTYEFADSAVLEYIY